MAMDGELFIKPSCGIDSRKRMADAGERLGQTAIGLGAPGFLSLKDLESIP